MAPVDRLERLTDLVLVLLHASSPKTLDEIARAVPGYPEGHAARRQAFERDKRVLRDEGIPVAAEPIDGPEQFGYRIDADSLYLEDPGLQPEEQAALHLAVAGVHLGDASGRDALAKLGASAANDPRPLAALASQPALVTVFDALREQAELRFVYHGERRAVAPATVRFRGGRWYVVGYDRERGAARTFRVDRIEGMPEAGPAGSGRPPDRFDVGGAPLEPWRPVDGDEDDHVLVRVDAVEALRVVDEVGADAVVESEPGGAALFRLGVASFDALRSWVLGLLEHAEVVGPPAARAAIAAWLEATSAGSAPVAGEVPEGHRRRGAGGEMGAGAPPPSTSTPSARKDAAGNVRDRLRRLLAIVAWLSEVGEASVGEISTRFDVEEGALVHELELAACCGVPPYSPDALLEIVVHEDRVQAYLPKELARPRRLTPREGFALAASARTILAVPGADTSGALGRALSKLEAVLGDQRRLVIDLDAPGRLEEVRRLVEQGVQAEITYHSASTDETTVRVVEPVAVHSLEGHWYLDAWCHRAEGLRRFRVDRITALRLLDASTTRHGDEDSLSQEAFVPGPGATPVVLGLEPGARWVADSVPVLERRDSDDGRVEVTLAVGGRAWLERLLLQAGPGAQVLAPADLRTAGSDAARRLLHRYQ